ncbi:unnamed protein product [Owenia fusiformis]|uniref:Uncharacterized protein n=1 Tax=Owenia fusiformis TaxID=6347 RepID=A0A8S4NGW0_OWEFU|nr:unnamed protein product [Owenia fusiformis]
MEISYGFRFIWSTEYFSNGSQVMVVNDKDGSTKAVLCDQQCEVTAVLVELSKVWHATCSPNNIAAVTCMISGVAMVKLFNNEGKHIKDIKLPYITIPSVVAFVNQGKGLLVADNENNSIYQIDVETEGAKKRKHEHKFQSIEDMSVNDNNDLFVVDYKGQSISCFKESGELIFDYNTDSDDDNDDFRPKSICVDKLGCVIVADMINQKTKLLNSDGNFLRDLTRAEDAISYPIYVSMNHRGQVTMVTNVIGMPGVYTVTYRPSIQ